MTDSSQTPESPPDRDHTADEPVEDPTTEVFAPDRLDQLATEIEALEEVDPASAADTASTIADGLAQLLEDEER